MKIRSIPVTLSEIVENNYSFNIPYYQRLYVWEEEQVKTLLEDIIAASNDNKELFYLGGVLVVEKHKDQYTSLYDLIDGQQRFTTLWMISIVFGNALQPFIKLMSIQKNIPRIDFAIRDEINQFFLERINGGQNKVATSNIHKALAVIEDCKAQLEEKEQLQKITAFIYDKISLIFTEVPKQTDLNKLFEVINNRGVQLQHHEILKARMLKILSVNDRVKYSYLWEACSNMDDYIEINIQKLANIDPRKLFDIKSAKYGREDLATPNKVLQFIGNIENYEEKPKSLLNILESEEMEFRDYQPQKVKAIEYEEGKSRSIIKFPMLLQHTLRIFLVYKEQKDINKILETELLDIFHNNFFADLVTEGKIKEFIELLWKVRYYFDKHVIRWVQEEDSETLLICNLEMYPNRVKDKVNYYFRRQSTVNKGEALLQSMLYHSQQITTHYWLTPYLKYLIDNYGKNSYSYLKHLDNHLLCSDENETLIVRTRKFLENPYYTAHFSIDILTKDLGTAFPHYWFYKLEFVLWETHTNRKNDKWKKFRITAKNSVEHISPRTQQDTDTNTVSLNMLNNFGNLALVSRNINSEYSNKPFNEKRQQFINKNREKLDSLKMDLIYSNEFWNDNLAQQHQDEMTEILKQYLGLK